MVLSQRRQRIIAILLLLFAIWDLALGVAAVWFPEFWFRTIHGVATSDPQALLRRTGGIWLAFAVFHFVAWRKWRIRSYWLTIVGGMRLGEVFADYLYIFSAAEVTSVGWFAFLAATPSNIFFAWFFISHGQRLQDGLRYLGPIPFRALVGLSEVLVSGEDEIVPPREIALRVDHYLAQFRSPQKFIAILALIGIEMYPLLSLRPRLSTMDPERRKEFIRHRFYRDVTGRRIPKFLRTLVQGMIRFGQQLSFIGYYSHPAVAPTLGYVPFSQRPRFAADTANVQPPPKLDVLTPSAIGTKHMEADVVIIGSGASGAVLAHELVAQNRDVLLIERGRHVPRIEFVEDEVEMIANLYDEGALQLAQNFRMQVLQGSCVGGTTVVNNAVCFDLPDDKLDLWNADHGAGIDVSRFRTAEAEIRRKLQVAFQDTTGSRLNRADLLFKQGLDALAGELPQHQFGAVEANIGRCVGCGYCNIGCKYGTKLDMRETFLPWAQAQPGLGSLTVLSECDVIRLKHRNRSLVQGVVCRLSDGRKLDVSAKTVVLAAGAISSPFLLLKSGIALGQAGQNVSFNIGSPITAAFPSKVDAYDALQISHFLKLNPDPGYVIETWYNPPVAQAMGMPGWFEDHFNNMRRYDHMGSAAPLVGTQRTGQVEVDLIGRRSIKFEPSSQDLAKIKDGLKLIARVFLAGGAERVMPSTFKYVEIKDSNDVDLIDSCIRDSSDVALGTGHPQGGCAVSGDLRRGVVDPEFRVRGFDNLYCCDASVFPTSIGVNPQLTVMSLAKYAAASIQ